MKWVLGFSSGLPCDKRKLTTLCACWNKFHQNQSLIMVSPITLLWYSHGFIYSGIASRTYIVSDRYVDMCMFPFWWVATSFVTPFMPPRLLHPLCHLVCYTLYDTSFVTPFMPPRLLHPLCHLVCYTLYATSFVTPFMPPRLLHPLCHLVCYTLYS